MTVGRANFPIEQIGEYQYKVAGWVDRFGTWKRDLAKRIAAGQDVGVELLIGADLVHAAGESAQGRDREHLAEWDRRLRGDRARQQPREIADSEELSSLMARWHQPSRDFRKSDALTVTVDRPRASFSAWYEMFPRSAGRIWQTWHAEGC